MRVNDDYAKKYGFKVRSPGVAHTAVGLTEETVRAISKFKAEPAWMLEKRLAAYKFFLGKKMPPWGADLSSIDFNAITYYLKPSDELHTSWKDVPKEIKRTFDRLGIPEAERRFLGGVGAQFESEVVYHSIRKELQEKGVVFLDTDSALKQYPELFNRYFGTLVPAADNKFAALNTAVWSGGSFVYIPKNVKVDIPLQAYFRINAKNIGQFERTLIIADEGSEVQYIEGCTAPVYSTNSLHAAVVEVFALKGAKIRYTTIQNWSTNVFNLVTKRAAAYEDAVIEWVDGNLGSKTTMKYPAILLKGERSRGDVLSIAFARTGQHQDTGAKVMHLAAHTQSRIISKSVSAGKGRNSYRGLVHVAASASDAKSSVICDALLMDKMSRSDTYPSIKVFNDTAEVNHEASTGSINEDTLFYLQSRGLARPDAMALIVLGFLSQFTKELPMEYALELNKLIRMEMDHAMG